MAFYRQQFFLTVGQGHFMEILDFMACLGTI